MKYTDKKSAIAAINAIQGEFEVEVKLKKKRTLTQNRALHLYCDMLAQTLNERGLSQMKFLSQKAELPWSQATVKENIWKPIQKAVLEKESTTEADTSDYSKVYEVLNRHLAEKFGIYQPWPDRFGPNEY